jgi:PAS domain S-box-containing protein
MISVTGFHSQKIIQQTSYGMVCTAVRKSDSLKVVLKYPDPESATIDQVSRYHREYQTLSRITSKRVIRAHGILEQEGVPILVLEYVELAPLSERLDSRISINEAITLTLNIARAIDDIHSKNIVYRNLNPEDILCNNDFTKVQLTNFSLASIQNVALTPEANEVFEGNIEYVSPEQTGRTNLPIDYRSDVYSLGVLLYQLLTGELPFSSPDYLELVFQHLAGTPDLPSSLNEDIPTALDSITLKLLEKAPDKRYQSVFSVISDLNRARDLMLHPLANPTDFAAGLDDIPEQLFIPDSLLDRESYLTKISQLIDSSRAGEFCSLLVSGEAGTGKSTLLHKVPTLLTSQSGIACTTSLRRVNTNVPYSSIAAVLENLSRQLLSRDDLTSLRTRIHEELGASGTLLIEIAPKLSHLISNTESLSAFRGNPQDSKKRLEKAAVDFINVVSLESGPVVLCIDNIQRADPNSLELFASISKQQLIPNLAVFATVSSSKTNEFIALFAADSMGLTNLHEREIRGLLTDCLYRSDEEIEDLSHLIFTKTQGNPRAIREFLGELHKSQHLYFEREHREWEWNLDAAAQLAPTNNVGEVLADNLDGLDQKTLQVIKIAACIGDEFDLDTIKRVSGMTFSETSACLIRAVTEGFLLNLGREGPAGYQFAHEKIQQTAYELLDRDERKQIHAEIGRTYLTQLDHNDRLFDVVNQLNNSIQDPNSDTEDSVELARLNLEAGNKAKQAGAFQAAFRYLRTAIAVQGKNVWQNYDLSLEIHLAAAEAAYFCGDRSQLDTLITAAIDHADSAFDKSRAYEIQIRALIAYGEVDEALEIGRRVLDLLRHPVPERLGRLRLGFWIVTTLIRARLVSQKNHRMKSREALASMRILMILCQAGYLLGRPITAIYTLKMTEISLENGLAPETSFAYPLFGSLIIRYLGTITTGYEFGTLAIRNLEDNNPEMFCRTNVVVHNFVYFWKHHLRETLPALAEAERVGFENGDVEFAQIAATTRCVNGFILGQDLNTLDANFEAKNARANELNQTPMLTMGLVFQQCIKNLLAPTSAPWQLKGELYDELECVPLHERDRDYTSLTNLYAVKTFLAVLFREHDRALEFAETTRRSADTLVSTPLVSFFTLFESLAYISQLRKASSFQLWKLRWRIQINLRNLRKWSQHAPMNTAHAYHLVQAEFAAANLQPRQAIDHYEAALSLAEKHGHTNVLGLIQELTGRFYERQNKHSLATFHLRRARSSYVRWGAVSKVYAIDEEFDELTEDRDNTQYPRRRSLTQYPGSTERLQDSYFDLSSVIKASQVLSGEIILETLLEKLMQVALENAGAHSAGLVLSEGDDLYVEILSQYRGARTDHKLTREVVTSSHQLPVSVIQYVARTQEDLVLNDVVNEDLFTQDDYITRVKPRSILCFPILSKSHLTGVLYLENRNNTNAFSQDRVAVLKLLASQSAIAIENAKLYHQLNDSKNKYLALYENAVEGIFEINMDGQLASLNPAAAQLIGYSGWIDGTSRLIDFGRFFVEPNDLKSFTRRLMQQQRIVGYETRLKRFDQQEIWVAMSAHLITDDNDKPIKLEGSLIDITERKLRQQAEQATKLAEAATQTKSQFLANMSHEIRTPMNAILGYTRLALENTFDDQQRNYLETIKSSSDHLLRVVNDILDISKIESGKLDLQSKPFCLKDVLQDIKKLFSLEAKDKGLELIMPVVPEGNYMGDAVRLGQVLINLIGNAIKFTRKGKITVELETLELQDGSHCINFVVTDTGQGIPETELENIFEAFTQTNSSSNESGTGLGLAISRSIVQKMHGHIHASSVLGVGSKFFFSVVLNPTSLSVASSLDQTSRQLLDDNQTLLLVEDNPINRDLAKEVLASAGYTMLLAEDGQEAIDVLNEHSVFAVLMDLRMPRMSGNEAIKIIRSRPDLRDLNVIALSAGVLQHEIDEALQNGFDHYVTKPVDFENLLRLLANLGGRAEPAKAKITKVSVPDLEIRGINFGLALRNHDDDEFLLDKLTQDFQNFYRDAALELKKALDNEQEEQAERLTHNIAGVAGSFGAENLMLYSRKLEHLIQKHGGLLPHHFEHFELEMATLLTAIDEFHALGAQKANQV